MILDWSLSESEDIVFESLFLISGLVKFRSLNISSGLLDEGLFEIFKQFFRLEKNEKELIILLEIIDSIMIAMETDYVQKEKFIERLFDEGIIDLLD